MSWFGLSRCNVYHLYFILQRPYTPPPLSLIPSSLPSTPSIPRREGMQRVWSTYLDQKGQQVERTDSPHLVGPSLHENFFHLTLFLTQPRLPSLPAPSFPLSSIRLFPPLHTALVYAIPVLYGVPFPLTLGILIGPLIQQPSFSDLPHHTSK